MTDSHDDYSNSGSTTGYLVPISHSTLTDFPAKLLNDRGSLLPARRKRAPKALLNGNITRRNSAPGTVDHVVWDTVLAGFGLQVRASSNNSWIVQYRQRGKLKKVTLGRCVDVDANDARAKARAMLAAAALDGLPKRERAKAIPLFKDYAGEFYANCFEPWKPATQKSNRGHIERQLIPNFGNLPVNEIRKADVIRWRDSLSARPGVFNRAIPVLSAMLQYAARLGYCKTGSNVSRGTPRYKREKLERYLSPLEYRRVAAEMMKLEDAYPKQVAALRMLLFTGARLSEITKLRWDEVQPPRLQLFDSKTDAKMIYLNRQCEAILASVPRDRSSPYVFLGARGTKPILLDPVWNKVRRGALIPDVRLHDIRHSYASAGIMDGVPLATIGKLFGHALHETTARYAHVADGAVADAAQRVSGSTPLGDVHGNFDWHDEIVAPFGEKTGNDKITDAEADYAENLVELPVRPTVGLDPIFEGALLDEFGVNFQQMRVFMEHLEDEGRRREEPIFRMSRDELRRFEGPGEVIDGAIADRLVDSLLLLPREDWRQPPPGLQPKDLFPWRFRGRVSLLRRPLIQVDNDTIIVAPGLLREAITYMLGNYWSGDFPREQLSPKMGAWQDKVVGERGTKLAEDVAKKLEKADWTVWTEKKLTELLNRKLDRDYGDIDVLAKKYGRVIAIECKDLMYRKTNGEISEQVRDYLGEERNGKRDELRKHLDRMDLIRSNITLIAKYVGHDALSVVESHLVFRNPVPIVYALRNKNIDVQTHILAEIEAI